MKRTFLFLLLLSFPCFAQFNVKYSDFKNEYAENAVKKDSINDHFTIIENSVEINFCFTKTEHKLISIVFKKATGISNKEINKFEDKYLDNFKPTRIKKADGISVYYDEFQELMKFKVFQSVDSRTVNLVAYTLNKNDIDPFIRLMDRDNVKSKLNKR